MNWVNAFTDGSSRRNGKPNCVAGWAFVAFLGKTKYIRYGHISTNASNNVGEIAGVLYATMKYGGKDRTTGISIFSDSKYVVNSINQWQHKHALTDYIGIKNSNLLVPLYKKWNCSNNLKIDWVKGHNGNAGNELADEYAGLGSDMIIRNIENEEFNVKFVSEEELLCLTQI